jgi:hypothetical protein
LQEEHDLLDGLLLFPGSADHPCTLGPEARHLNQARRLLLDHAQRVQVEVGDDALGHLRPDALDEARAKVAPNALDRSGQHRRVVAHLELLAELGMALPDAAHAQALARLRPEQVAHDRGQVAAPAHGDAGDGVAVLLVGVGDALEDGLQGDERDGRG